MSDKNKFQWTPEPWLDGGTGIVVRDGMGIEPVFMASLPDVTDYDVMTVRANIERALACVNAMAGIECPEKFVRRAKGLSEELEAECNRRWEGNRISAQEHDKEVRKLKGDIERLRALLKEAADDIEETVEATYYGMDMYPHQRRRKERDMDLPRRIRAALEDSSDEI